MGIIKFDPFRELRSLQDEMNRLFNSNFPSRYSQEDMVSGGWTPSVDIYETEDEIVLEAELPGMKREDFEVSIENNVVTLKGERNFEKKEENENYHRVERAYGSFTRSFSLPSSVSPENTNADFSNGILRVTLPKQEETKTHKIEITGEDQEPRTIVETEAKASSG